MERKLTAIVLATVVLLSVLGATAAGAHGGNGQAANESANSNATAGATVTVSATGTAAAQPDQAVVYVAVTAEAPTAGEATTRVANNVSRLRDSLDSETLSVMAVETVDYQVGEETGENETTYVARHAFAVTTDEPNLAGDVIDVAVNAGADEVGGVRFQLSEDRRQEVRADAIDAAVTDAQVQAEALSNSTGLTLGEIQSISTGGGPGAPPTLEAADAGTQIDASPVSVSVTVQVTYNATA